MDSILKKITSTAVPKSLVLRNSSRNPAQASLARSMSLDAQERLVVDLDSVLALDSGANVLQVEVTLADGAAKTFTFRVQADGPAATASTPQLSCYPRASLAALDVQGAPITEYAWQSTAYTFRLNRSPGASPGETLEASLFDSLRSPDRADAERLALSPAGRSAEASVYQGTHLLHGVAGLPQAGNGRLEAYPGGWLQLTWKHGRDPRESASLTVRGSRQKVTAPPTADPPGRTFTSLDPGFTVSLIPGEAGSSIHYTLDGTEPGPGSSVYGGPIPVSATTTIKAFATKPGQAPSTVVEFAYVRVPAPKVANPTATPPGPGTDSYAFETAPLAVSLAVATPGAAILASFGGSDFREATGISAPGTGVLRMFATKPGMYPSDTVSIEFEFVGPSRVFVRFANGKDAPQAGDLPGPRTESGFRFIPIDRDGIALPGGTGGKCGPVCQAGANGPGASLAGPIINLELPGPCRYSFTIYSNQGEFVTEGEGEFTEADLVRLAPTADGKGSLARVVWTGWAQSGRRAGTGAYILRSVVHPTLRIGSGKGAGPRMTLTRFGMVRHP